MAPGVFIDGADVSGVALEGSVKRRLNRPSEATVTIPMDYAVGGPGSRLKVVVDGGLKFHGFVLMCETDAGEDMGYTVYNAQDPMEMWRWRPARDWDGDLSDPDFIRVHKTGPQILYNILLNSENNISALHTEGPLFLQYGGFEGGGAILTGMPTNWPMTIADIANLMTSTGEVDIILTPIDSGGNMAAINVYNGNYGADLTGSVIFQYGLGAHNVRSVRVVEDMSNMVNKLWYYLGPKLTTQRWAGLIHGEAPVGPVQLPLPDPPLSQVQGRQSASRGTYGTRMEIQVHDSFEAENDARPLYQRLWLYEAWARSVPRTLVHISPQRGMNINAFDIGDKVGVQVSSAVRGGFSGWQRVYEYTTAWTVDGPFELTELVVSATQEGI